MKEIGEIIDIKGAHAIVKIKRSSYCRKCGACGLGTHRDEMQLTIPNRLGAKIGDQVELDLDSSKVLKASAILYVIPLMFLIAGVYLGYLVGPALNVDPELAAAICGILLTIAAFTAIKALEPVFRKKDDYSPNMVSIVKKKLKGEQQNEE